MIDFMTRNKAVDLMAALRNNDGESVLHCINELAERLGGAPMDRNWSSTLQVAYLLALTIQHLPMAPVVNPFTRVPAAPAPAEEGESFFDPTVPKLNMTLGEIAKGVADLARQELAQDFEETRPNLWETLMVGGPLHGKVKHLLRTLEWWDYVESASTTTNERIDPTEVKTCHRYKVTVFLAPDDETRYQIAVCNPTGEQMLETLGLIRNLYLKALP